MIKVLILCGGPGTRLHPITKRIPKPLVQIRDKPILHHIMDYFYSRGLKNFIVAIGYKGNLIKDYLNGVKKDWKIEYSDAGNTDMVQRIKKATDLVTDEFIVVYGDTIADVDLTELMSQHKKNNSLFTLTTHQMQSPFGLVSSDNEQKITEFKEKPILNYWMNIGFMVINKKMLDHITKEDDMISFIKKAIKLKKIHEYKHTGKHITVNTEKEKEIAEEEITRFYTYRDN